MKRFTTIGFLLGSLLFVALAIRALDVNAANPAKASVSFRVGTSIWLNDARFRQLLDLFDKYPNATDEVTFFTQTTHTPIPDDELERRCVILKDRIAETKARGYRAGINILCTMGHHPEDLPHAIGPEIPRGITINGVEAQGTLCPNSDAFRQRIRRIFTALAKANPDYIWIDDDVRVSHMIDSSGASGSICFCDTCMKALSERFGTTLTREELGAKFGDPGVLAKVRQFSADSINDLFALIEKTVHETLPDVPLGFMTGERYEEGYDFNRWAITLSGPNRDKEVYWRPGGGFYSQDFMSSLFEKSHQLGRQISLLPPEVVVVQSEIENFPYQPLSKSANVTTLEAVSHIAAGCTGAAFNVLTMNDEPLDEYEHMIATVAKRRPFFDLAVQNLGRVPNVGVFPLWERTDANFGDRTPIDVLTNGIAETGVPVAYQYSPDDSNVFLLSRSFLNHHSRDQMKEYFKKGVYFDLDTVGLANDPGTYALNDLTGMEYGGVIRIDGIEKFTDHELNGKFAGRTRDLRQSFWREPIYELHLTSPKAETLSSAVDYGGNEVAKTILGIYENPLGGRVCLNGYFPWSNFYNYPKQSQIRRIMRWLSKDTLPGYVDSFGKIHFWMRKQAEDGSFAAVAINANFDPAEEAAFMIKTELSEITVYDFDCNETSVKGSEPDSDGYRRFVVPEIAPWQPILIVGKGK